MVHSNWKNHQQDSKDLHNSNRLNGSSVLFILLFFHWFGQLYHLDVCRNRLIMESHFETLNIIKQMDALVFYSVVKNKWKFKFDKNGAVEIDWICWKTRITTHTHIHTYTFAIDVTRTHILHPLYDFMCERAHAHANARTSMHDSKDQQAKTKNGMKRKE